MSEQTFVQQLVQESLPVWEKCLHSEFLTHLADGTLDEACFKGYIVEDSLYLREYAKVFAWGMTKAKDMQTIRTYYSLLSFVNESEDAARLHYLKHFGLTDEGIQSLPLRPENRALLRRSGVVFWLDRPVADIERTLEIESRPLLAGGGSLETLRRQREALYRICADYTIREDTAQAAAEAIAAIWRKQT